MNGVMMKLKSAKKRNSIFFFHDFSLIFLLTISIIILTVCCEFTHVNPKLRSSQIRKIGVLIFEIGTDKAIQQKYYAGALSDEHRHYIKNCIEKKMHDFFNQRGYITEGSSSAQYDVLVDRNSLRNTVKNIREALKRINSNRTSSQYLILISFSAGVNSGVFNTGLETFISFDLYVYLIDTRSSELLYKSFTGGSTLEAVSSILSSGSRIYGGIYSVYFEKISIDEMIEMSISRIFSEFPFK